MREEILRDILLLREKNREAIMLFDTIAAISTPRGEGGIGIVRISGSDAFTILKKIFNNFLKNFLYILPIVSQVNSCKEKARSN